MIDLMTWLRVELDEDERALQQALVSEAPDEVWWKDEDDRGPSCLSISIAGPKRFRRVWSPGGDDELLEWGWVVASNAQQLFSLDQVRERLADVNAKRCVLDAYEMWADSDDDDHEHAQTAADSANALLVAVRLLALPYADRPGYREEWRP
jgi:hypothetical protein